MKTYEIKTKKSFTKCKSTAKCQQVQKYNFQTHGISKLLPFYISRHVLYYQ